MRNQLLTLLLLGLAAPAVLAERSLVKIAAFPKDIALTTNADKQSYVVVASYSDGITKDVTEQATATLADPKLATLDANVLRPTADGATKMTLAYEGQQVEIPVTVKDATKPRPLSFRNDVMPVFMKASCNTGSCHGAARGKDGFMLSLFGYDPEGDHFRLTREQPERRIDLAVPERSLLLLKAHNEVAHTGGKLFGPASHLSQTLLQWLELGAPNDPPDVAQPIEAEILPIQLVMESGDTQKITVRAKYSDGTDRDVTNLALFLTSNENSASISDDGVITAHERGEAYVFARFATFTVGAQIIVVPRDYEFTFPEIQPHNYIDELVFSKLNKLRMSPSEVCSDERFIRRAYLDIVGLVPTREEFDRFMKDEDPKKREKLVDELLGRKEFFELWTMKFAELLQIRSDNNRVSYKNVVLYYNWLLEQFTNEVPMDEVVQQLLSSSGGTFAAPATNYYQIETDTKKVAENVAQVFMGMRIQCAQCHNHPFDRWTMDDYYGFTAFFSQIGRKRANDPRETVVFNSGGGEVRHLVDNRVMTPKFLGGEQPDVKGKDRREVLAKWLASPDNPYFASNLANIIWSHFFGIGIIEPVDDVRVTNPPTNPELLAELAKRFTEYDYDFKKLVRDICTSRTYQLSTQKNETNASDDTNFASARIRRIRAEVMLDVIAEVTEQPQKFQGLPLGARAVQIADGRTSTYFLTTFGRASRDTVCSCEVKMDPNLSQAFHLLNGPSVQPGPAVKKLLDAKKSPSEIVEELYVRCFSRYPTEEEKAKLTEVLAKNEANLQQTLEDVFWALLNSKEFMFNR